MVIFFVFSFALVFERQNLFCAAFSVLIGHSHSIFLHGPRIPLQKFNMCNFVASVQAVVEKAGNVCEYTSRDNERRCVFC